MYTGETNTSSQSSTEDEIALMFSEVLRQLNEKKELDSRPYEVYEIVPKHELKDTELAVLRKVER